LIKRKSLGDRGENLALKKLKSSGYRILGRNFKSKFGEIDIIAKEGDVLVFIEVKTRWSQKFGRPEEAITPWKIQKIIKAGQYYKLLHPETPEAMRLDVVAVDLSSEGKLKEIRLIKNVTR
jgi:putative endonuclease